MYGAEDLHVQAAGGLQRGGPGWRKSGWKPEHPDGSCSNTVTANEAKTPATTTRRTGPDLLADCRSVHALVGGPSAKRGTLDGHRQVPPRATWHDVKIGRRRAPRYANSCVTGLRNVDVGLRGPDLRTPRLLTHQVYGLSGRRALRRTATCWVEERHLAGISAGCALPRRPREWPRQGPGQGEG